MLADSQRISTRRVKLSPFILKNLDLLLRDWEHYASSQLPAARMLNREELLDSAAELLEAVAVDMVSQQSPSEQSDKSKGMRPANAPAITGYSHRHAATRLTQGFTLDQMTSEYRALRASVMRHWRERQAVAAEVEELIRFNESMDQSLIEAVAWYGARIEHARELFLGVLSHDLRNPLNAVVMGSEALRLDKNLSDRSARAAARILAAAQRMTRLLDDLLDFTRTRLGTRLPMAPVRIQLGPALEPTVEELRGQHPDVELIFECEPDLSGDWDASRLQQMVSNLVGNAIQHGTLGKPVRIQASRKDTDVVLTVHNVGPPIAASMVGRIFDPLMRGVVREAERRNDQASLGLGLYISQEIARAHGGRIEVTSDRATGTRFTITLPATQSRQVLPRPAAGKPVTP
jgi:signal transduction histidine kinase